MLDNKTIPFAVTGNMSRINFSIDSFKDIREGNFLYVDKTKLIEDILTYDDRKVILFTRPRRFGKSLNISMLRCFFDMADNTTELFQGLYIEQSKYFQTHLNQYPVLYFNFKDIRTATAQKVEDGILRFCEMMVQGLYKKYQYEELKNISLETKSGGLDPLGVKEITRVLREKTGKRVIILVDEYDSVINQAYGTESWKEAASIVKKLFGALFKSNPYLELGILTGVSRIGKELGFSDMNNLSICGLMKRRYYEYFGFTEEEVKQLLHQNNLEMSDMLYRMYNGYHFEDAPNMFNPASMLKFLDEWKDTRRTVPLPYWINAAANQILKDNITKQNARFKEKLLRLLDGGTITEIVFESIDYEVLDQPAHLFSLLIDTGYLCPVHRSRGESFALKIPNEEVLYGYRHMIDLITGARGEMLDTLCRYLTEARAEAFEKTWNEILLSAASYHDFAEKENSYHNLMMGALLYLMEDFHVRSNRESGLGRYDIALIPIERLKDKYRPVLMEFKAARGSAAGEGKECTEDELLALAEEAVRQIEGKQYAVGYAPAYQKEDFLLVGIGAQGKRCKVVFRL